MSNSEQIIKKISRKQEHFRLILYHMFIYIDYYSKYFELIPRYSSKVSPLS